LARWAEAQLTSAIPSDEQFGEPGLERFLGEAQSFLERAESECSTRNEVEALLASWPQGRKSSTPQPLTLPACRHLGGAMDLARATPTAKLCDAIAPLLPRLHWSYGYPADPRWPSLASSIAFAQIVGPQGIGDDDTVHVGLTLLAPHTHYPLHLHPAVELYLVLSGNASWRVRGQKFDIRPPGSLILHVSNIAHAMETRDEPLLALYTWRGDLNTSPVYVEE
jgi:mannose-6-phosphate isomerase-like protein (cupin superfamily)